MTKISNFKKIFNLKEYFSIFTFSITKNVAIYLKINKFRFFKEISNLKQYFSKFTFSVTKNKEIYLKSLISTENFIFIRIFLKEERFFFNLISNIKKYEFMIFD